MQWMVTLTVSSSRTLFVSAVELRKGPKVDLTKSRVPDPQSIPVDSASRKLPQTMWRVDRLRDMTYTQFWHLIQERQIARVSNCPLHVTAAGQLHVLHLCYTVVSLQQLKYTGVHNVCSAMQWASSYVKRCLLSA